jgi:hypothetical protein
MASHPEAPVLQRIHGEFYTYARSPNMDHTSLSRALIQSMAGGYRIVTNPHGRGNAFEGLALDVTATDGLFGEALPTKVEVSHDTSCTVRQGQTSRPKVATAVGSGPYNTEPLDPPEEKRVVRSGDPGFDLFAELHAGLGPISPMLQQVLDRISPDVPTADVKMHDSITSLADGKPGMVHHSTNLEIRRQIGGDVRAGASFAAPTRPSLPWEYRSGQAFRWEQDPESLDRSTLLALSGLHVAVSSLYSNVLS